MAEGQLHITVLRGHNLRDVQYVGKQDPYCEIHIGGQVARTNAHEDGGTSPVWNVDMVFMKVLIGSNAIIKVYDKNSFFKDVRIGTAQFALQQHLMTGQDIPIKILAPDRTEAGQIFIRMRHKSNRTISYPIRTSNSIPPTVPPSATFNAPAPRDHSGAHPNRQRDQGSYPNIGGYPDINSSTAGPQGFLTPSPTMPANYGNIKPVWGASAAAASAAAAPQQQQPPQVAQPDLAWRPAYPKEGQPPAHQPPPPREPPQQAVVAIQRPPPKSSAGGRWIVLEAPGREVTADFTFRKDKALGEGAFGVAYAVTENATGRMYACKCIDKKKIGSPDEEQDIRTEVEILQHLQGHPQVVAFKDVYENQHWVYIVMELCKGGELFDRICEKERYSEADAAQAFRTILGAVDYCHSRGVLHRDLKPENFLLAERGDDSSMRLADFGLSVFLRHEPLTDYAGSAFYMAPEVIRRSYGKEADLWSCGVILYILLCGQPPFYGDSETRVQRAILTEEPDLESPPWNNISHEARAIVRGLLAKDPRQRASAAQVLAHPWMGGAASSEPINADVLGRWRKFRKANLLKNAAIAIIAKNLPAAEIALLRDEFVKLDSDGSGSISIAELRNALQGKLNPEELQALLQNADADGDGEICYQEFLAATLGAQHTQREEQLRTAFIELDKDGSGTLSREEVALALQKHGQLSDEAIEAIIQEADQNDDGCIDFYEFCEMMKGL